MIQNILNLEEDTSQFKTMNSKAQKIQEVAKNLPLQVGKWKGKCTLLCVPLDDFDLILGVDFFLKAKVALLPHLRGLRLLKESMPCFMQMVQEGNGRKSQQPELLSAIQLKKGLETYVVALVEIKYGHVMEVPNSVAKLLYEFDNVMPAALPKDLPPRRPIDHRIELIPRSNPLALTPYWMSPVELLELRKKRKELLDAGLIQPSRAPYGAPVLFQKKQDRSLRMCVDYRALNKATIKIKYPIPLATELFDRLSKATYFTKLDLRLGYWQVQIVEGDKGKTTCVTRYGAYKFLVMPFGLTNATATSCNLMNNVFF